MKRTSTHASSSSSSSNKNQKTKDNREPPLSVEERKNMIKKAFFNVPASQIHALYSDILPDIFKIAHNDIGHDPTFKNRIKLRQTLVADFLTIFSTSTSTVPTDARLSVGSTASSFEPAPEVDLGAIEDSTGQLVGGLLLSATRVKGNRHHQSKAIKQGIVFAAKADPAMKRSVRQFDPFDPKISRVKKAAATWRRREGKQRWKEIRNAPNGLGKALDDLDLLPPSHHLIPNFPRRQDTDQYLSELQKRCKESITSCEKCLKPGVVCKVFNVATNSWCAATLVEVHRENSPLNTFIHATANVTHVVGQPAVLHREIERRSIKVQVMPPQKEDPAVSSRIKSSFVLEAAIEMGLTEPQTEGLVRFFAFFLDGTGVCKSETHGHIDVTTAGINCLRGGHLDKSIHSLLVDMVAMSKDSKLIWNEHFASWAIDWDNTLHPTDVSIALLDYKAIWDTMNCLAVKHIASHPDQPHHNVPKALTQLYDKKAHRKLLLAFPNKTKAFIKMINRNFSNLTKFFNQDGTDFAWRHEPEHCFHGPLHWGRDFAIDIGLCVKGAEMAGGETFAKKYMRHLKVCCRLEIEKHSDRAKDAHGRLKWTVRKGVGAMKRQTRLPNFVPLQECTCGLSWPEAGKDILEALRIHMLICRRARIPMAIHDLNIQKEFTEVVMVRTDLVDISRAELEGGDPYCWTVSARTAAVERVRLLKLLNEMKQMIAQTGEDAIEAAHIIMKAITFLQAGNFGGDKCNLTAREKNSRNALGARFEETEDAQSTNLKRTNKAIKRHAKRDKILIRVNKADDIMFEWICDNEEHRTTDPEMLQRYNAALNGQEVPVIGVGSPSSPSTTSSSSGSSNSGSSESDSDSSESDSDSGLDLDSDSDLDDDNDQENGEDLEEESIPAPFDLGAQVISQVQQTQSAFSETALQHISESKKTLTKLIITGDKGSIAFPIKIDLGDPAFDVTIRGTAFQSAYLWTRVESSKMNCFISETAINEEDTTKAYTNTYGIQFAGDNVLSWYIDVATKKLYIKLKGPPKLVKSRASSLEIDPTSGYLRGVGLEIVACVTTDAELNDIQAYMRYLQNNTFWTDVKATSLNNYKTMIDNETITPTVTTTVVVGDKSFDNIMMASANTLVQEGVYNKICNRAKLYEEYTEPDENMGNNDEEEEEEQDETYGLKYGWYTWGCALQKRPVPTPAEGENVTAEQCAVDHYVGVKRRHGGIPCVVPEPSLITQATIPGIEHLTCDCHIPLGMVILDNDGNTLTEEESKNIVRALGCTAEHQQPVVEGATRVRTLTERAQAAVDAALANMAAAADADADAADAADQAVNVPAPVVAASTSCMGSGTGTTCTALRAKKSGVLGGLCNKCALVVLKDALNKFESWNDTVDGDELDAWIDSIATFIADDSKKAISKIRSFYCQIVTKMRAATIRLGRGNVED